MIGVRNRQPVLGASDRADKRRPFRAMLTHTPLRGLGERRGSDAHLVAREPDSGAPRSCAPRREEHPVVARIAFRRFRSAGHMPGGRSAGESFVRSRRVPIRKVRIGTRRTGTVRCGRRSKRNGFFRAACPQSGHDLHGPGARAPPVRAAGRGLATRRSRRRNASAMAEQGVPAGLQFSPDLVAVSRTVQLQGME